MSDPSVVDGPGTGAGDADDTGASNKFAPCATGSEMAGGVGGSGWTRSGNVGET
jgi:hypothetical protein